MQHAELWGRVGHREQRGGTADNLISSGSSGTACPSLTAGIATPLSPAAPLMTGKMEERVKQLNTAFCGVQHA